MNTSIIRESRPDLAQTFAGDTGSNAIIAVDDNLLRLPSLGIFPPDRQRRNLFVEETFLLGGQCLLVGGRGKRILHRSCDTAILCHLFR